MSAAHMGVSKSDKHKENIRLANIGNKNPMWGKSYKKTSKQIEMSAKAKWKCCIVNGVEYESVKAAAAAHNIKYNTAKRRAQIGILGWKYK